jgi:hypothetical protein
MENVLNGPLSGQFPYRLTTEERFQYHCKVQPVAGQLEFSIRPVDTRLSADAANRAFMGYPSRVGPAPETDRSDNVRKAKLRAKGRVKLLAMEMGVDRLFTFTIRKTDDKVLPYDDVLSAWDYFRRMALKADRGFRYVATPEQQKNGQWHIHAGLAGFQNVQNFTRMWQHALNHVMGRPRSMTKGPESPGTCNIANKKKPPTKALTRAKWIARYIAKYIGKSLETAFNRKSHFHSTGIKVTPAQRHWLEAKNRDQALLEVLRRYGLMDGDLPAAGVTIWNRDSCSAWFTVPAADIPPPF